MTVKSFRLTRAIMYNLIAEFEMSHFYSNLRLFGKYKLVSLLTPAKYSNSMIARVGITASFVYAGAGRGSWQLRCMCSFSYGLLLE